MKYQRNSEGELTGKAEIVSFTKLVLANDEDDARVRAGQDLKGIDVEEVDVYVRPFAE